VSGNNDKPLISIITVCYNSEKYIRDTIESVLNQTYDNIEYIIVDGESTDKTLNIIKEYESKFNGRMKWISEPDEGIYDAMNKGIDMVNGDWINFMNAGDSFYNLNILSLIFSSKYTNIYESVSILYGKTKIIYNKDNYKIFTPNDLDDFWKGIIFNHQSSFVRADIMKKNKFNTQYVYSADFNLFYHLYKKDYIFKEIDLIIANYDYNGISSQQQLEVIKEYSNIISKKEKNLYYFSKKIDVYIRSCIKKILPNKIVIKIQKNK
jgi:glycosyltransferase involved in cell wall biosynthesis